MKFLLGQAVFGLILLTCIVTGFIVKSVVDDLENKTLSQPKCDSNADLDLSQVFSSLDFNASWISRKYFWLSDDFDFEARSKTHFNREVKGKDNIIKVIVLPHSHNDPGWLNTYELYYYRQTKYILDNAVESLLDYPEMTFVWSEITYLAKWWGEASQLLRGQFKKLINEGRLEIATGGWVVPDEATSSLYSLAQEITEGQQWLHKTLNVTPKYSWAIDPFGHSSTHSHLLRMSNMKGMVVQRLHYAWKHWLAQNKMEDFRWRGRWDASGTFDINCHTLPYDLYSIKHACGPQPDVCLKFDFRSIAYEYGENYGLMSPITKANVKKSAQELASQYQKSASLTKHNVVLVPLGDDFRYDRSLEWQQQYTNYMQLFSHINSHRDKFRMEIGFGTLSQYFEAVDEELSERGEERPSLSGDFFPYGDVYVSGKPSYWTGFYGTRPYWKRLHREVENELRSAEILFTYANAIAKKSNYIFESKSLSYKYQDLITSRHDFALFAHHDGITGTSTRWTMEDYGDRLHAAYQNSISMQIQCLKIIYKNVLRKDLPSVSKDFIRERFEVLASKVPIEVFGDGDEYSTKLVVFNNLAWKRRELVKLLVKTNKVKVVDSNGEAILSQLNPVFKRDDTSHTIAISQRVFELVFIAELEPLSFSTFRILKKEDVESNAYARVRCDACTNLNETVFKNDFKELPLTIENNERKLYFDMTGLLDRVEMKDVNKSVSANISYGFYPPVNRESGAYLLKPILSSEYRFFGDDEPRPFKTIRITGPILSKVIAMHVSRYETVVVNTTLLNDSILLENYVDFAKDSTNKLEVFMRLDTSLKSNNSTGHQVMYTDQNGLVSERRVNIPSLNYEGNMYPVTTMAYIQDEDVENKIRFSILVDRAHGFNSMAKGRLETLIERKNSYNDGRGMPEGVTDSKPTVSSYILLLEKLNGVNSTFFTFQPTLKAHQSSLKLNYKPNIFVYNDINEDGQDQSISLVEKPLPNNVHLFNLRTVSEMGVVGSRETELAGNIALLNLQYLLEYNTDCLRNSSESILEVRHLNISKIEETSLTGVGSGEQTGNYSTKPLFTSFNLYFK